MLPTSFPTVPLLTKMVASAPVMTSHLASGGPLTSRLAFASSTKTVRNSPLTVRAVSQDREPALTKDVSCKIIAQFYVRSATDSWTD